MLNLFKYVGFRHMQWKPLRTLLTVLGVGLGVTLFVAIQLINESTLISFQESMEAISGKATLVVTQSDTGFPEEAIAIIKSFKKEVRFAAPMVQSSAYFTSTAKINESLMILGVDMLKETSIRSYKTTDEEIMDDPLIFLNQPDSVIVTKEFAERNHLNIDSKIEIATTTGKKSLTVRGLLTPEGPAKAYGGALALMDIDGAQATFGKIGKYDRVDVVTRPNVDIDLLCSQLSEKLGAGYRVERPSENSLSMERLIKSYQTLLNFFSTLALLVGVFLVANTVGISVAERRREIGTLRALGATRVSLLSLFVAEAAFMGFAGSLIGLFLGRILASQLIGLVTNSMSSQYLTLISASKVYFPFEQAVWGILAGTIASVAAGLWPAYKAATVKPIEAMKKFEVKANSKNQIYTKPFWFGLVSLVYLVLASVYGWGRRSQVLEVIAEGSIILGSAFVAPALVNIFILYFKKIFDPQNPVLRISVDNLLRHPRRTASNVMALMIGLILVIQVAALNQSFKDTLSTWFDRVLKSDVLVSSNGKLFSFQVQPLHESLAQVLEKVPGILKGPKRSLYGVRFNHFSYNGKKLALKAFDEPHPDLKYAFLAMKDGGRAEEIGPKLFHSKEPVIVISDIFSFHQKKKTGDFIEIATPTGNVNFKILGVMFDYASPEGIFYINRESYKKYWKDQLVDSFGFNVAPGFEIENVRREIDARYGKEKNLMTVSQKELKTQILQEIDRSFAYTKAIEAAALLVGLLGLFNTFMISVMERTREIGMLRAIGMERIQMIRLILNEALIQGGFGASVAAILGAGLSYIFVKNNLTHMLGWIVDFSFPGSIIVMTLLIGLFVAALAAFYPARKAANLEIREALEYE